MSGIVPPCWFAVAWTLAIVAGCDRPPTGPQAATGPSTSAPAEDSFTIQVARVRAGESDRIKIEASEVGDSELLQLAGLTGLRHLVCKRSRATDHGLTALRELTQLESLVLQGAPRVSDAGLSRLAGLMNLRTLNLGQTEVTDDGLVAVAGMTRLTLLRLGSSHVAGPGLAHLSGMQELRHLILQDAPLTDDGLSHLRGLRKLESLYVEQTRVTPDGIADLLRTFPHLHVHPHL
jgi:hypothetical protein